MPAVWPTFFSIEDRFSPARYRHNAHNAESSVQIVTIYDNWLNWPQYGDDLDNEEQDNGDDVSLGESIKSRHDFLSNREGETCDNTSTMPWKSRANRGRSDSVLYLPLQYSTVQYSTEQYTKAHSHVSSLSELCLSVSAIVRALMTAASREISHDKSSNYQVNTALISLWSGSQPAQLLTMTSRQICIEDNFNTSLSFLLLNIRTGSHRPAPLQPGNPVSTWRHTMTADTETETRRWNILFCIALVITIQLELIAILLSCYHNDIWSRFRWQVNWNIFIFRWGRQ